MRTLLPMLYAVLLGLTFAGSPAAAALTPTASVTATLLGQTGEDIVGTVTQAPDGIKDVHVKLTGVPSPLTSVKVTGADGIGNWQAPKHANWWLVAIMPQTDPSIVDLYFDPRIPESAYTLTVTYSGGKQTLLTVTPPPPMWTLQLPTFGSGTGTTTGAGVYPNGTVVTPGETPAAGSLFNGWLGVTMCTTGTVTMTANTMCTAAFTLTQWTLTIATAGTGSGATTGAGTYVNGTVVTMTAAPATGSTFAGWTGTGCTTGTMTMTANAGCTAVFTLIVSPPPQWTLTITTAGTGSGATTGAGTYVNGTVVTMTAVPATGSTFAGWTGTGCTTGTVTMTANVGCTAAFTLVVSPPPPTGIATAAELPRVTVDTSAMPVRTGRLINVPADYTTIQAAVNAAAPGDEIVVQPTYRETGMYGTTATATLTLPYKGDNTAWIWIHTAALSSLPPRGTRINADTHAQYMPKIVSPGGPTMAMNVANKANHYWITGLEFQSVNPSPQGISQLVAVGVNAAQPSDLPSYIVFDRDYLHGELDTTIPVRGGLVITGNYVSVEDSVLRWFWSYGHTQALWVSLGTGIKIHNNYLDATSQNLFIGARGWAGTNAVPDLPQDITITHNHVRKDQSFLDDPKWKGIAIYSTLFEMKSGLRVLVEGNIFERTATQDAYHADWAIILKSENNNASSINPADYTQVRAETSDITIRYNIVRHTGTGIMSGTSTNINTSATLAKRHTYWQNLFYDLNNPGGANALYPDGYGNGTWYGILLLPMSDFLFAHNTVILGKDVSTASRAMHVYYTNVRGQLQTNTQFSDNIFPLMRYGFAADNGVTILTGLEKIFNITTTAIPGAKADHNLVYAPQSSITSGLWPDPVGFAPANSNVYELHTDLNVGYANPVAAPGGYALASGSGKNSASDGTDRGADVAAVLTKTAGVEAGLSAAQ